VAGGTSSFRIVTAAPALPSSSPAEGFESTMSKLSFVSTSVSLAIASVTSWLVWPAAKTTRPDGRVPPKSAAFGPVVPRGATAQSTLCPALVLPSRVSTKVRVVLPLPVPSASSGVVTATATREVPSSWLTLQRRMTKASSRSPRWPMVPDRAAPGRSRQSGRVPCRPAQKPGHSGEFPSLSRLDLHLGATTDPDRKTPTSANAHGGDQSAGEA
jgi:hypothetical protein